MSLTNAQVALQAAAAFYPSFDSKKLLSTAGEFKVWLDTQDRPRTNTRQHAEAAARMATSSVKCPKCGTTPGYLCRRDNRANYADGQCCPERIALLIATTKTHSSQTELEDAWNKGHESGFWNGRESAGNVEMKLCGVEHAKAHNPFSAPVPDEDLEAQMKELSR